MTDYLRHAQESNDKVPERIYICRCFKNDTGRLEKLFKVYTRMTTAGKATTTPKATKGKKHE